MAENPITGFFRKTGFIKKRITFQLFQDENTPAVSVSRVVMQVNPNTLVTRPGKQVTVGYTNGGFTLQHWHDKHTVIMGSGLIKSYNNKDKEEAESYRKFRDLIEVFKLCGRIIQSTEIKIGFTGIPGDEDNTNNQTIRSEDWVKGKRSPKVFNNVISYPFVEMRYSNLIYRGVFEAFDVTEEQDLPTSLKYNFTFLAFDERDSTFGTLDTALDAFDLFQKVRKFGT